LSWLFRIVTYNVRRDGLPLSAIVQLPVISYCPFALSRRALLCSKPLGLTLLNSESRTYVA